MCYVAASCIFIFYVKKEQVFGKKSGSQRMLTEHEELCIVEFTQYMADQCLPLGRADIKNIVMVINYALM